jgi:hypothetical protein
VTISSSCDAVVDVIITIILTGILFLDIREVPSLTLCDDSP